MPITREQIDAELTRREQLKGDINAELARRGASEAPPTAAPQPPVSAPVADRTSPAAMLQDAQAPAQAAPQAPSATPYGFSTDASGQNIWRPDLSEVPRPTGIDFIDEYMLPTSMPFGGAQIVGAVRDAATGVMSLPYDLVGMDEHSKKIQQTIPRVEMPPASDIGSTVAQYAVPGAAAAKGAVSAVNASKAINSLPPIVQSIARWLGGAGAAGVTDAVVTDPGQANTIGDFTGGPTDIQADDSNIEKRLKMGGEAAAIGAGTGAVGAAVQKGLSGIGRKAKAIINPLSKGDDIRPPVSPDDMAEYGLDPNRGREAAIAGEYLNREAIDPQRALQNMDATKAQFANDPTFTPPAGAASADPGLIGVQKSFSSAPDMVASHLDNLRSTDELRSSVTGPKPGPQGDKAAEFIEGQSKRKIAAADAEVETAAKGLSQAEEGAKQIADDLNPQGAVKGRADASEALDTRISDVQAKAKAKKGEMFDAIDPEREVKVDTSGLLKAARNASRIVEDAEGGVREQVMEVAGKTIKRIRKMYRNQRKAERTGGENPNSFQGVQNMRAELSSAIAAAREKNYGGAVQKLTEMKKEFDSIAEVVAKQGDEAGQRAKDALANFKDDYAPKVLDGKGGEYAAAAKKGKPVPPTKVGDMFIRSDKNAGRESAKDLATLVGKDPKEARDFMVNDMVSTVMDQKTGTVDPAKLEKWMDTYQEALAANPKIRSEVLQIKNNASGASKVVNDMQAALEKATAGKKATQAELDRSVARVWLGGDDPVHSISKAMRQTDKAKAVREMVSIVDQDPTGEAKQGLKAAFSEWLDGRTTNTARNLEGDLKTSAAKVGNLFKDSDTRKALEAIYDPQEIKAMEDVRDRLAVLDRVNINVTAGSPTASNLKTESARETKVLSTLYMATTGKGVIQSNIAVRRSVDAVRWISEKFGYSEKDSVEAINEILKRSMIDPDLAKILMMNHTNKTEKVVRRRLGTYLTNNIIAESTDNE